MVNSLKRVMVKRPDSSFQVEDAKLWHYTSSPNLTLAQKEHDEFVSILKKAGVSEVIYHETETPGLADSIFVHDPVLMTDKGANK